MGFGARLKDLRERAGLSGEALGGRLGVSKQTISHWEKNRYEPDLQQLRTLCATFNTSADYLISGVKANAWGPETIEIAEKYQKLQPHERQRWRLQIFVARDGASPTFAHPGNDETPPAHGDMLGGDSGLMDLDEIPKPKPGKRRPAQ